jgi:hypothetical protein
MTRNVLADDVMVYRRIMIRRNVHWVIAVVLVLSVAGACIVRTRSAPPPRGRPVYVVPAGQPQGHEKHKEHRKHEKHREH